MTIDEVNSLFESYLSQEISERTYIMGPKKRVDRIFKGKVQRRKYFANRKGYTMRKGKLVRMSPIEIRNRQIAQRRAAKKRKAKQGRALMKRKISLRKRKAMGFNS